KWNNQDSHHRALGRESSLDPEGNRLLVGDVDGRIFLPLDRKQGLTAPPTNSPVESLRVMVRPTRTANSFPHDPTHLPAPESRQAGESARRRGPRPIACAARA